MEPFDEDKPKIHSFDDYDLGPQRTRRAKPLDDEFAPPKSRVVTPSGSQEVLLNSRDRWSQYERDQRKLKKEAESASASAILSAANREADRQSSFHDNEDSIEVRLNNGDTASRSKSGKNMLSNLLSYGDDDEDMEDDSLTSPHERVRKEAMKMLEMADDISSPYRLRQTKSGGFSTSTGYSTRRTPSSLSGLDLSNSARSTDKQFSIDGDEEEYQDIDVVKMESSIKAIRSPEQIVEDLLIEDEDEGRGRKSWSDRYSSTVDRHMIALTGGMTKDEMMSRLDAENEHSHTKTARNMFSSSPYDNRAHQETRSSSFLTKLSASLSGPTSGTVRYWAGSWFRNDSAKSRNSNLSPRAQDRTVWMDVDLSGKASSLPPPSPAKASHTRDWRSVVDGKKSRRRRRIIAFILVLLVCIIGIVYGVEKRTGAVSGFVSSATNGNALVFYVTSNTPYTKDDESRLHNDLASLPTDADFVVHLGNIQKASITLCPETTYSDTRAALRESPAPVFILPGEEDWNNCPDPGRAWNHWSSNFDNFEYNFDHDIEVERQLGREENFAFVREGVLFIGMTMVTGRITSADEWEQMFAQNVLWTEKNIKDDSLDDFRAVVIFGHARPSQRLEKYFFPILDDVNNLEKPVLYVHANGGGIDVRDLKTYTPYSQAPLLSAVQIKEGGKSAPARLTVGFNSNNPFRVRG